MPADEVLLERIANKALKRIGYSASDHKVKAEYSLTTADKNELVKEAVKLGYDPKKAPAEISRLFVGINGAHGESINEVDLSHLNPGVMLSVTGEDGAVLTLLALARNVFFVVDDLGMTLAPGEIVRFLQYSVRIDGQLMLSVNRNSQGYSQVREAYRVERVISLKILRNSSFLYRGYVDSSSTVGDPIDATPTVYADYYDMRFNAFTDGELSPESYGQLYEIDVVNMTYRLNPDFDKEANANNPAVIDEIYRGFKVVSPGDNIYLLQPVEDGRLELCSYGNTKGLRIVTKASVQL